MRIRTESACLLSGIVYGDDRQVAHPDFERDWAKLTRERWTSDEEVRLDELLDDAGADRRGERWGERRSHARTPISGGTVATMTANVSGAVGNRAAERRRAVALARHYREAEGLSIVQIADRLGRSPATVKAYF